MHEKVKEFLDAKKAEERKEYAEKKQELLIELGLYEKVYSENEEYNNDFPYSEYDSENSKTKWYKKEAIAISDEEYEEVKKYSDLKNNDNDENPIATILKVIAVIVYIAGFIASFFLGVDRYGDISAMVMVWWIVFFIAGTIYLGFAEIIKLLDAIKKK